MCTGCTAPLKTWSQVCLTHSRHGPGQFRSWRRSHIRLRSWTLPDPGGPGPASGAGTVRLAALSFEGHSDFGPSSSRWGWVGGAIRRLCRSGSDPNPALLVRLEDSPPPAEGELKDNRTEQKRSEGRNWWTRVFNREPIKTITVCKHTITVGCV